MDVVDVGKGYRHGRRGSWDMEIAVGKGMEMMEMEGSL